jgi:hypothetical protein
VAKSDDCVNNEHGSCKGIIKEAAGLTKMCACPCHDSTYQLVRNTIAVVQSQRNNPYQFMHESDA